ncbi:SusC/RagA family TonB-linked outer membrane protein [Namhaeicola litoreus]|uniref:SusC/RagA family TonB-linked outer membrane protein n=1 Tax=Namhaeicola litoreus TaxID=1052145 RepID=A0ABW3Y2J0_9FLAO
MKNNYLIRKLIFLGAFMLCGFIQAQSVTGKVSDANGPLPGANVLVKGTSNGVVTDFDGNYALEGVDSNAVLEFSFVGYATLDINVNGQSVINATLSEDANQLEEVVVVGYTSQTRGDITGSVSSVDLDEALKVPVANAAEALQGRVTGVNVVTSGAPGAAPKITIRGFGTYNSTDPLYIIDGVQTTDPNILNSIDPGDIAQMNVLKDGAASIYGARAANGVIIVTTKSGSYAQQKATLSLDVYSGFSTPTNLPDLMNHEQHKDMLLQTLINDGTRLYHPQYVDQRPNDYVYTPADWRLSNTVYNTRGVDASVIPGGTKWAEELTRNAPTTNVNLSLQGGNDSGKYFMSVGYLNRDGILKYTGFERYTTRLNSEFKIKERLTVGEHLNIAWSDGTSGNAEAFENALRMSPVVPVFDNDGNLAGTFGGDADGLGNTRSGYAQLYRGRHDFNKSLRVFGDVYAAYEIIDGLTAKTSFGISTNQFDARNFQALDPEHSEPLATNTLGVTDQYSFDWTWTNTLNYAKTFGNHNVNALLGIESVKNTGSGKRITRTGYLFETPDFYNLSNGSGAPNVEYAYEYESSLYSVFGSVNYSYASKYFLTATLRQDTSSKFRGDNKTDWFPSFSAGWLVSAEDFWPTDFFMSRLKFKASYGELGNQEVGGNPTINESVLSEQFANYALNGSAISTGAKINSIGNPDLKWETSKTTNIGAELGFFQDKLYASIEWYTIVTSDLIAQDFTIIPSTGPDAGAPFVNIGEFKNTGIDFALGFSDVTDSGFSYGLDFNLSKYKNEVVDLASPFYSGDGGFRGGAITRTEEGRSLSEFYGRVVEGLDDNGRFVYKDVDGNGTIDDNDRTYIGSPLPDFTYGINARVGFAGFDVSAFFTGSEGNEIYNYNRIYTDFPTFVNGNRSTRLLNSWTPTNTDTKIPALSATIQNSETNPNSFFVEDGSFFRLKNLQVGYTIPDNAVKKMGMDSFRVYVQGTNIFTITDYTGIDPEVVRGGNLTLGVDWQNYPFSQIYTIGFNIKF